MARVAIGALSRGLGLTQTLPQRVCFEHSASQPGEPSIVSRRSECRPSLQLPAQRFDLSISHRGAGRSHARPLYAGQWLFGRELFLNGLLPRRYLAASTRMAWALTSRSESVASPDQIALASAGVNP